MKPMLLRFGIAGACLASSLFVFADDAVRKVPKDLNLPVSPGNHNDNKLAPPATPPDKSPGNNSSNNAGNDSGNNAGNPGNEKSGGKAPVVNDDHCQGSPGCSTLFDGGKSSKN